MDLAELLSQENSRLNTDIIANFVSENPPLFNELWQLFLINKEPVSRRAAWVVDVLTEKYPEKLTKSMINNLIDNIQSFRHDGMKRHSLHLISRSTLPAERLGEITGICFDWLMHPGEAVATKMYSMEILYLISEIEPDLKNELADSIRMQMLEGTPGIKSCGRRILSKLGRDANRLNSRN
jgi:hypothetical protein